MKPGYNHFKTTMPNRTYSGYLFLSDLHLSSGLDPLSGSYSPLENFIYDEQFARFLSYHQHRALEEGRELHLLLLGDIFDFLRVSSPSLPQHQYSLDTSIATALQKIEQIAAGHVVFFEALGRLLNAGFSLEIMPGNHDIEITQIAVQEKVKALIERYGHCSQEAASRINFYPWIYYLPGVFYAEHGQQHHWINSFPNLAMLISQERTNRIRLPVGSHFEIYLQALLKATGMPAPSQSPVLRSLLLNVLKHPVLWVRTAGAQLRFLGALLGSVLNRSNPWEKARQKAAQEHILPVLSSQCGLSGQTLNGLVKLWRSSDFSQWLYLLRKLIGKRTAAKAATNYLYQSATTIHELLMSKNEQVPYYIFGHTHQPAILPLKGGTPVSYYVNGGSWIGEYAPTPRPSLKQAPDRRLFRYIYLTTGPGAGLVEARLLVWNDSTGLSEPVSLEQLD